MYNIIAFQIQLWLKKAHFILRNSYHCFVTSLVSKASFPLPFTLKLMARSKGKTILWKPIFIYLSISNKTIGPGFYLWPNLHITMWKMQAPVIYLSSWTAAIIFMYFTKKILILVPSQNQLMNYWVNFEYSCQFVEKTSIIPKNFKSKPTIRTQSLKSMLWVRKFG